MGRAAGEAFGIRPVVRIERFETPDRPVPPGDRGDEAMLFREPELFVLECADLRIFPIEARDQLLGFGGADVELERERGRTLAGKRREVDDLAELAIVVGELID